MGCEPGLIDFSPAVSWIFKLLCIAESVLNMKSKCVEECSSFMNKVLVIQLIVLVQVSCLTGVDLLVCKKHIQ